MPNVYDVDSQGNSQVGQVVSKYEMADTFLVLKHHLLDFRTD